VKNIIGKLFQTKFGGVMMSFNAWKTMPERKDGEDYKAASKFLLKLTGFLRKNLKL
jgi:hypothetical protein